MRRLTESRGMPRGRLRPSSFRGRQVLVAIVSTPISSSPVSGPFPCCRQLVSSMSVMGIYRQPSGVALSSALDGGGSAWGPYAYEIATLCPHSARLFVQRFRRRSSIAEHHRAARRRPWRCHRSRRQQVLTASSGLAITGRTHRVPTTTIPSSVAS